MTTLRPNNIRAKWAIALIILVLITEILSLFSDTLELQLLYTNFSSQEAEANNYRQRMFAILNIVVLIISAVTYIRWFRRAYYNLHQKAETLNYEENAASYSWFIPFVNWIRPHKIMKELYLETESLLKKNDENFKFKTNYSLISIWWVLWITTNILSNIQVRLSLKNETIQDYIDSNIFSLVINLLSIPVATLAILVIKNYSQMETLFYSMSLKMDEFVGELKSYPKLENDKEKEIIISE